MTTKKDILEYLKTLNEKELDKPFVVNIDLKNANVDIYWETLKTQITAIHDGEIFIPDIYFDVNCEVYPIYNEEDIDYTIGYEHIYFYLNEN